MAFIKSTNEEFLNYSKVVLHEMMHVLGFSPTLYDYFISEQGKTLPKSESQTIYKSVSGSNAPGLKTKNLLEFAKKFYDCPTI